MRSEILKMFVVSSIFVVSSCVSTANTTQKSVKFIGGKDPYSVLGVKWGDTIEKLKKDPSWIIKEEKKSDNKKIIILIPDSDVDIISAKFSNNYGFQQYATQATFFDRKPTQLDRSLSKKEAIERFNRDKLSFSSEYRGQKCLFEQNGVRSNIPVNFNVSEMKNSGKFVCMFFSDGETLTTSLDYNVLSGGGNIFWLYEGPYAKK